MDIELIYAVKALLLPCSSLLVLALVAAFRLQGRKKMGFSLLLASLLGLYVLSIPLVSNFLASLLEAPERFKPIQLKAINPKDYQAIVILGSGLRGNGYEWATPHTVNSRTLERVRYGAYLSRHTGLPVLVTGGIAFGDGQPSEAFAMADTLVNEFGVAVRWQEGRSRNTAENAEFSRELLRADKVDKIILVTHAFHMPRSVIEFQRVGFQVLPGPTAYLSDELHIGVTAFIPSAHALHTSNFVLHEYLGMLWYQLRYH
jgi:uncharacterized SAM-binding protein YcdF (DUF218 family)